ncbi:CARDB domain-containing protein [Methanobacterium alcaliphilum]|uniref:CARDB domain-containing protein n=1 Tax=Methanobacterium alcaliphilum TaxID=392018 RepID=UPI00200B2A9C|nr:CARDB domain-containing protein [Methanobacterium alcaliphilum]MCK9151788.1 hypothetical protein [Methanobacterium alcaliphilum]
MIYFAKKKYFLIVVLVLAVFLCGAVSAANITVKEKSTAAYSPGKDLVVTKLTASKYIAKNTKIVIKTTVKNKGKKSVNKGHYVYYYLVPKKSMTGYKKYLGKKYFPKLKPGQSVTKKAVFNVPDTLRYKPSQVHPPWEFKPVTYYVVAKADGGNKIPESREKNNIHYTAQKTEVFYKKIDSGSKYFSNYRKLTWITFLINSKDILAYCHFYDPYFVDANWNPQPHWITQKYIIGTYTKNNFRAYLYLNPKQNGRSDYVHYSGTWQSPWAVYWQNGKSMFEDGPNIH